MRARNERYLASLFPTSPKLAISPKIEMTMLPAAKHAGSESPPPEFTWREFAVFLLTTAAEIEHSLMVQYLYAGWSLGGAQVPEEHQEAVTKWRQIILGIAKEEMGHLVTVQNVIRFLGAPLALDREDYPWDSVLAPYPFALERLTRTTLAKYIVTESPETWPDDVSVGERKEIERLAAGPDEQKINRVGALYKKLIELIGDPSKLAASEFHPESYPTQSSWDEYARGYGKGARGSSVAGTTKTPDVLVMRAASRADAVAALSAVAEQGEAPDKTAAQDDESSHFRRFLTVFRHFPKDGAWEATIPVPSNPVAPGLPAAKGQSQIEDDLAGLWANIFNIRYRMLLSYLAHSHTSSGEGALTRRQGVVINRMFAEMYTLRAVAAVLSRHPLNAAGEQRAAAPFQMPYSLQLPDSDAAFWRLHIDLLAACRTLLKDPRIALGTDAEYAATLLSLDATAAEEMRLYADAATVRTGHRRSTGAA
ncbi:ferritin-like domain-containing protein [Bradyrhizobium lupini]|uniref:ferritin-like domain-containing protein n=1 Tax=Rhizobium lupini TaxID=136996 RepID=UPI00366AD33A